MLLGVAQKLWPAAPQCVNFIFASTSQRKRRKGETQWVISQMLRLSLILEDCDMRVQRGRGMRGSGKPRSAPGAQGQGRSGAGAGPPAGPGAAARAALMAQVWTRGYCSLVPSATRNH